MNVLLLTSHAIAEHDDLEMFTRMGIPVYSIGGAYDEAPFEGKRPAVANVIRYPDLEAATNAQRARMHEERGDPGPNIDWAKARLAPEVIDWADTIIVHHFPEQWIGGQWSKIRNKRVIWRTCGQSDPRLERAMTAFVDDGLQVVRYSPKEREAFGNWGSFAGEHALIRFGKDPHEWSGWTGEIEAVGNITQHMAQRGDACGYGFWSVATDGIEARPAGPGSDDIGGLGELTYDGMRDYLRGIRAYCYTGTRPASYTLGLMEAMLTGTPVVAMGPEAFYPPELYEAHAITGLWANDPKAARGILTRLLRDVEFARSVSSEQRARAIDRFGLDKISAQWAEFLA